MKILVTFFYFINLFYPLDVMTSKPQSATTDTIIVKKCEDFVPTGKGDNPQWNVTDWTTMVPAKDQKESYETRFKMLYSDKGMYVLGYCEDKLISTDYATDQGDIWNGDVFEVFLQTDPSNPLYFEYEINPLNAELAILVPNNEGDFFGWSPWHYEGERKVKKAVEIHGGKAISGEKITGWTIEVFFPYTLFKALKNVPPKPGTQWKGNLYRMDYDTGERFSWSWRAIDKSFHEYKKFGHIVFK